MGKQCAVMRQRSKANHILSAWSKADGVCFGQVTVNDKSNEITAIPKLWIRSIWRR